MTPGCRDAIGKTISTTAGAIAGALRSTIDAIDAACDNSPIKSVRPPGAIDAIRGAREWGKRNGVDPREAVDRFHDIKRGNRNRPGSRASDDCSVNPDTGEIYDATGEHIGDLGDGH